MEFLSMEQFEILGDYMDELREWQDFEADMMTDPYDDEHWADRMDEYLCNTEEPGGECRVED